MKRCKNCSSIYSDSYALPFCEKCSGELEFFEKSFFKEDKDKTGKSYSSTDFKGFSAGSNNVSRSQPDLSLAISPMDSSITVPKSDNASGKSQSSKTKSRIIIIVLLIIIVALSVFIVVNLNHNDITEAPTYLTEKTTVAEEIITETEEMPETTTGAEQTTETVASEQTTMASVQEQTTAAPVTNSGRPSTPGTYTVDSDTGFTRLRADHSVDGEYLLPIPTGEKITVSEVYENTSTTDKTLRYWGKVAYVDYLGKTHNGWVAMWYLK